MCRSHFYSADSPPIITLASSWFAQYRGVFHTFHTFIFKYSLWRGNPSSAFLFCIEVSKTCRMNHKVSQWNVQIPQEMNFTCSALHWLCSSCLCIDLTALRLRKQAGQRHKENPFSLRAKKPAKTWLRGPGKPWGVFFLLTQGHKTWKLEGPREIFSSSPLILQMGQLKSRDRVWFPSY